MSEPPLPKSRNRFFWALIAVIVSCWLFVKLSPKTREVDLRIAGRVHSGLFVETRFELTCWHQFPGDLKQGTLSAWIKGKAVSPDQDFRLHSFEILKPNRDQGLSFSFPLTHYDPRDPLEVTCFLQPDNAGDSSITFVWQNGDWQESNP